MLTHAEQLRAVFLDTDLFATVEQVDEAVALASPLLTQWQEESAALRRARDDVRKFVENWCAIRNVSPADTAAVLRGAVAAAEACVPYLKDGETPAECIERNRKDIDAVLTLLANERRDLAALREAAQAVLSHHDALQDAPMDSTAKAALVSALDAMDNLLPSPAAEGERT